MKIKKSFIQNLILSDKPIFTANYMYTACPRNSMYTFDTQDCEANSRYYEIYRFDIDKVDFSEGIFTPKKRPFFCGVYNSLGVRL